MAALLVAWALLRCGSTYAAGSGSFGYLSQARLFAQGRLTATMPRHEGRTAPTVPRRRRQPRLPAETPCRTCRARPPPASGGDGAAEDEDGQVVAEARRFRVDFDRLQHRGSDLRGRERGIARDDIFESGFLERLAGRIFRFRDPVAIENERVAGIEECLDRAVVDWSNIPRATPVAASFS